MRIPQLAFAPMLVLAIVAVGFPRESARSGEGALPAPGAARQVLHESSGDTMQMPEPGLLISTGVTGETVRGVGRADEDEATRSAIEATLGRFARLRETGDESLIAQVIDPRAAPLRRIVTERVRNWRRTAEQGGLRPVVYRVTGVRSVPHGYVKADIHLIWQPFGNLDTDEEEATYVFRQVEGAWLLSEPTEAELGERRTRVTDHFRVHYYEWDEPLIDEVAALFERAYAADADRTGFEASEPVEARLYPTFMNPNLNNRAYAYYVNSSQTLFVRSSESYGFGSYPPGQRNGPFLTILKHEYGHHIVNLHLIGAGYAAREPRPWLNEGLAEWLTDRQWRSAVRWGFSQSWLGDDLLEWTDKRLVNETTQPPEQVSVAYAVSAQAVRYIVQERGGLDRYWQLVDRYMATRDMDASARDVFGQSWRDFQAAYRGWLRAWTEGG